MFPHRQGCPANELRVERWQAQDSAGAVHTVERCVDCAGQTVDGTDSYTRAGRVHTRTGAASTIPDQLTNDRDTDISRPMTNPHVGGPGLIPER
jgi:hypothetical protein